MFQKYLHFLTYTSVLFFSLSLNSVGVNQAPSITFSASQDKLLLGSDVTLNWSTSNANFCVANGDWQGEKKTSGSESIVPSEIGFFNYTLKCVGAGGESSKELSLEVYKYIDGVVVDGYIRDANVFNDLNQNFIYEINEDNTFTDINGSFVLKFGDVFVSLGGFDTETNNSLEDFLLFTNLDKDFDFVVISPLTSLRYFYDNKTIFNLSIGVDESIDVRNIDPIVNLTEGREFETLFEKGTQLGILAYSLQNISNHINTSENTTEIFFSLLANAIEERYINSNEEVDIYSRDFIGSILRKLNDNLDSEISFLDIENTTTLLTGIVNNLNIKSSSEGNNALFDFSTSIFQDDLKEVVSGNLNTEILNYYETDILEYIANELNIQRNLLEPKYAQSNNLAPVIISSNTFYVDENTTTIGQVLVEDQDTPYSEITYEIYDGSSVIDVSSSGLLSFFNPQDYETQKAHGCPDVSPYFTYGVQVSDGVNIARQELCIYINDLDEGDPIFLSDPNFDFNKDAKYIGIVEATDPNGEYVSFSVNDARLEIEPISTSQSITYKGILRFKEDFDQSSQGSFTSQIIASDGTHTTEQQINLITPNAAPVFTSSSVFTAPENQLSIGKVTVTDDDNDQITYSVSGNEISISVNGDLTFIFEPDFETQASYSATVSADDGYDVTTQDITINVENVNEPPTSFYQWNPEDKTHGFLYAHESMTKILGDRWGYDDALNQPQLRVGFVDPEGDSLEAISGDDLNITKISTSENGINVFEIKLSEPVDYEDVFKSGFDVYETTFSITDGELNSTFVTPITIINNPEAPIISGVSCHPERNEECYIDDGVAVFNLPENTAPVLAVKFISPDGLQAYQSCNVISSDFYDDFNDGGTCPSNEDDELVLSFGLNYSSDYEFKNSYSFKFEATTSAFYYPSFGPDSLTSTFDVIVNIVDEDDTAPELTTNNNFWIDENTLDIGTVTATDVDTDNSLIRFTTSSTNIEIDNITGQAVFISPPDYEQKTQYVESVTVSDGINSSTGNIEINIDNVNDNSPVLNFDAFRVDENETYIGIAEATDADGDQLTYSLSGDGADVLTINQEGELRFIEAPDFETKESYSEIVVNVSDGLNTSSRGIGILINNVNDNKPTFTSTANFAVDENETYIGMLEATDADGDTVSFSTNSSQITINQLGEIVFNNAPDYEQKSEFKFTVTATDGLNTTNQRITITINDINDAPTFSNKNSFSSNENKKRVGRISSSDQDNDVISFEISGGRDQNKFRIDSNGNLFFLDFPNFEQPADDNGDNTYEFQITISDQVESTSKSFTVDVIDINDQPVIYDFIPSIFYAYENGSTFSETVDGTDCSSTVSVTYITCGGNLLVNVNGDKRNAVFDEDGDSLTYSITGTDSEYLSVTQNSSRLGGGAIFLLNHADFEAKDSYDFILNVSDGSSSVSSSHQIQVIDIDEAPIVSSSTSISLNENISDVIAIQAEDPEGKSIIFSLGQSNEGDSSRFEITTDGQLSLKELYTNFEDYPTSVAYVYISDDNNSRSPTVFTVNLQDINDAPVINDNFPSVFEVNENATTTFYSQSTACISKADRIYLSCSNVSIHLGDGATQDTVSDEDGDGLSYSITGQDADKFGISAAGSIYMKAPGNFEEQSSYSFILNVSDGDIVTSKESIVVFTDVNEPPVFTGSSSFTIEENETTVGLITAEDPEGDWVEFIMGSVHDGDSGSFTIDSNGSLAFRSAPDFETKNSFTAHLFVTDPDGSASFTSTVITIDVTNVNDNSPTFTSTNEFSVDENISLIGTVEAIDIDGDDFTFSTTSSEVAIDEITGEMVFISSPDYETQSSYSVEVVASDGLLSETQTIAININDTNDVSPTITSTSFIVDENESSIGSLTLSDPDTVNSFTYSIDSSDISIDSSGNLTFNSAPDYETTTSYTATVTVNDGENTTSESISISIIDLDDEIPVITSSLNYFVNENTTLIGTITASDDDAGSTLTFSLDSVMDGIISIDASTGVLSFDEAKDYESSGDGKVWGIQVYVSDGTNSSDEHIHIHLNNNNDNDHEFIGQNLTVDENDNEVGTIFFTDRDIGSRVDYCLPEDSVLVFQSSSSRCSTTGYAGSGITWSHSDTILTLSTYDYESDSSFSTIITAEDYNTNDEEPLTIKTQVHNINVTIVDVDEAPVFTNSTQISIDENETTVTQIVATDDDGDAITYSLYGSDSQYFTIDANTGDLSLRSAADYESRDSYTSMIVIADSGTNSSNLDLDVFINDVNEPPVFTSSRSFSVMENRINYYDVYTTAEDPEGEQVFYRLLYGVGSDAEKLQIDRTSGGVRARACIYDRTNDGSCSGGSSSSYFDFEAQSELNFQVVAYTETDQYLQDASSEGTSATESFQINVLDEEETFYWLLNGLYLESSTPSLYVDENESFIGTFQAIPIDSWASTDTWISNNTAPYDWFDYDQSTGFLSFKDNVNIDYESQTLDNYTPCFSTLKSNDRNGDTYFGSICINVYINDVNEAPTLTSSTLDIDENQTAIGSAPFTDQDGDSLSFSISGGADQNSINIGSSSGTLVFADAPNYEEKNAYEIEITVSDGSETVTESITININDVNEAPAITSSANFTVSERSSFIGTVTATDEDPSDTISYSLQGAGSNTNNAFIQDDNDDLDETDFYELDVDLTTQDVKLRIFNNDDYFNVSIKDENDVQQYSNQFGGEYFIIDVDQYVSTVGATIDLELINCEEYCYGYSLGWELIVDNNVVFTNSCSSCANDSYSTGVVYQSSIYLGPTGEGISIDSSTGALSFDVGADYESTSTYQATVIASDGELSDSQDITVTVANVDGISKTNEIYLCSFEETQDNYCATNSVLAASNDGSIFVVGMPNIDTVKVFKKTSGAWSQHGADITGVSADRVDISGDGSRIIFLSHGDIYAYDGIVSVKEYDSSLDAWIDVGSALTNPGSGWRGWGSGVSIDEDGDTIVIGAGYADVPDLYSIGAIKIFNYDQSSSDWLEISSYGSNVSNWMRGWCEDNYCTQAGIGYDVDINNAGDVVIASGPTGGFGQARVFYKLSNTWYMRCYQGGTDNGDGCNSINDKFMYPGYNKAGGFSSAIKGDSTIDDIVVTLGGPSDNAATDFSQGDPIHARTWKWNPGYNNSYNWEPHSPDITRVRDRDHTGYDVSLSDDGSVLAVSAPRTYTNENYSAADDFQDTDSGAVTIYSLSDMVTTEIESVSFDSNYQQQCGHSIDVNGNGDFLFFTCPGYSDYPADNRGRVIIYSVEVDDESDGLPSFTSDSSFFVNENETSIGIVTATDSDGDTLEFSVSHDDIQINTYTGELTFSSPKDYESDADTYTATIFVTDGTSYSSQDITVYLTNVNDNAPVISSSDTFTVIENETSIGTVSASDADGNSITFSISSSDISIDSTSGVMTFNSAPDYDDGDTAYSATITVSDGSNDLTQEISITITDVDDTAPVFTSDSNFSVDENETNIGTVTATDVDTDDIFITFSTTSSDISIDAGSGVMTFNSAPDYETASTYTLTVIASDNTNTNSQEVTISINDIDDTAPTFTGDSVFSVNENETAIGSVVATDIDTDDGSIVFSISGSDISIGSDTGILTFNTAPDFEITSSYNATVTASDGERSTELEVLVNILDVNDIEPTINSSSFTVNENETSIGNISITDGDSINDFSFSVDNSSMEINSVGSLSFVTPPDYESQSSYTVTVTVNDGVNTVSKEISIEIVDLNDTAPYFNDNGILRPYENQSSVGRILAYDDDSYSEFTYSISGSDISIDASSGVMSFISLPDYESQDIYTATLSVSDGENTSTLPIEIYLRNEDDNLTLFDSSTVSLSVDEGESVIGTVTASDADVTAELESESPYASSSARICYSIISGDDNIEIDGQTGELSFKSWINTDYESETKTYTASVKAQDCVIGGSSGSFDTQTVNISLNDINDETPEFNFLPSVSSFKIRENQTGVLTCLVDNSLKDHGDCENPITATDADANSVLSFSIGDTDWGANQIFNIDNSSGLLTLVTPIDYEETKIYYSIPIVVSDGLNSTSIGTSNIYILNENDNYPTIETTSFNRDEAYFMYPDCDTDHCLLVGNIGASDADHTTLGSQYIIPFSLEYEILDELDADYFNIDSDGNLRFAEIPDFDTSTGGKSAYQVNIKVTDYAYLDSEFIPLTDEGDGIYEDTLSVTESVTVTLNNVSEPPYITSSNNISFNENENFVTTVTATDPETGNDPNHVIWFYIGGGGADDGLFDIDYLTGDITFKNSSSADFENPSDSDGDGIYEVEISTKQAHASYQTSLSASENIYLTVSDVNEAPYIKGAGSNMSWVADNGSFVSFSASVSEDVYNPLTHLGFSGWDDDCSSYGPLFSGVYPFGDEITVTFSGTDGHLISLYPNHYGNNLIYCRGSLNIYVTPTDGYDYETKSQYDFSMDLSDGVNSNSYPFVINVVDVDEAPVFTGDTTFTAQENTSGTRTISTSDPQDDDVTLSIVGGSDADLFNINGSQLAWVAGVAPDYESQTSAIVIIRASDGTYYTDQEFVFTITDANDNAPIITSSGIYSVNENESIVGTVDVTDPDGGPLLFTFSATGDNNNLQIDSSTGVISFKTIPSYEDGVTEFANTLTVRDTARRQGGEGINFYYDVTQSIFVNLVDVNEAPVFTSDSSFSIDENTNSLDLGIVSATDEDGDSLTYSISGSDMTIDSLTGALSLVSTPDYELVSSYSTTVTVSDGVNSSTQNITVSVNDQNDNAPVFTSASTFSVDENETTIGTITVSDVDTNSSITFSISGSDISIDSSTGVMTFNSAPDYENGETSFAATVTVSDGVNSSTQNITVSVNDQNDNAPVFTSASTFSVDENETTIGTITVSDVDTNSSITFSISGSDISIDSSTGVMTFNSAPDYESQTSYVVTVSANDGVNITSQNITININNVDEIAPVITSDSEFTIIENETAIGTITASDDDSDGSSLIFSISGSDISIDSSTGVMTFNSAPDYDSGVTLYFVNVTVSDGLNSTTESISISITDIDDEAPDMTSSWIWNIDEGETFVGTVTATDVDTHCFRCQESGSVSFSISGSDLTINNNGSVWPHLFSSGEMVFNTAPDYESGVTTYLATLTASDGINTTTQEIRVDINDVDDEAPNITSNSTFSVDENETVIGTASATDIDTDDSSIIFSVSGSDISIDSSTGEMTFISQPDFETQDSYTIILTASDGTNESTQEIIISINDLDDSAPTFTSNATFSADENQTSIGTVTATDVDSDNSSITFSISGSDISIDASSGVMTFNSAPDYESQTSYSATVTVSDGINSDTQSISVNINNLNDNLPEIVNYSSLVDNGISINENQTTIYTISANDDDGDDLTYSIASMSEIGNNNDAALMDINPVSGLLSFNSPPDYENPLDYNTGNNYLVRITVSDGEYSHTIDTTVYVVDIDDETPMFTSSSTFAVDENETAIGTVAATDVDSDDSSLIFSISGSDISIDTATGVLTFNSAPDYESQTSYTARVTASDGSNSNTQDITVSINDLDDTGPTFTSNASFDADENQTSIGTVTATDVDSDDSLISFSISGSDIAINSTSGVISFISAPDYESQTTYAATVTASDGNNASTQDITVNINNINEWSPSITSSSTYFVDENETTIGYVEATDIDGDSFTFSLLNTTSPDPDEQYSGMIIDESSGLLEFTGTGVDFEERDLVSTIVVVSDGENSATKQLSIYINDVDDVAPVITSPSTFAVDENQTLIGTITATDVDTDDSLITFGVVVNSGDATNTNNAFPKNDHSSLDETDFYYYDIGSGISSKDIDLRIYDVDDTFTASFKDPLGNEQYSYTAQNAGTVDVTINVNDWLSSDGSTIDLELYNSDNGSGFTMAWQLIVDDVVIYSNSCGIHNVYGCADNSTVSGVVYEATIQLGGSTPGQISVDETTGILSFETAPSYETASSYSATISASDGANTSEQDITININDVNDAPTFSSTSLAIEENHSSNESFGSVDITDDDGDILTYSITGGADQNVISIDSQTGSLSINHSPDYENPIDANGDKIYEVTITASDGSLSVSDDILIYVTNEMSGSIGLTSWNYKWVHGFSDIDAPKTCITDDCNNPDYWSVAGILEEPSSDAYIYTNTPSGSQTNSNSGRHYGGYQVLDIAAARPDYDEATDRYFNKYVLSLDTSPKTIKPCIESVAPWNSSVNSTSCPDSIDLLNAGGDYIDVSEDGNTIAVSNGSSNITILRATDGDYDNWSIIGEISNIVANNESFHLSGDGNRILVLKDNGYLAMYEYENNSWSQVGDDIIEAEDNLNLDVHGGYFKNTSMNLDGTVIGTINRSTSKMHILEENNNDWSYRVDPIDISECCDRDFDMDVDGDVIVYTGGFNIRVAAFNGYDAYNIIDTFKFEDIGLYTSINNQTQYLPVKLRISSHSGDKNNPIGSSSFHQIYVLTGIDVNDGEIAVLSVDWNDD